MQAPLLIPGLSRVHVEQLRQQQQQHSVMSSQGTTQQREQQLQVPQQHEQRPRLFLQRAHPQQQQTKVLQPQQEPRTQPRDLQPAGQPHLLLPHQQMQQHQLQQQQQLSQNLRHRQLQMQGSAGFPKISASTSPECRVQYPCLFGPKQLPTADPSRTSRSTAQQQQQFSAGNSSNWAPTGAPIPSTPPLLQHQPRMSHQQLLQQQQPQLQQQELKLHQEEKQEDQQPPQKKEHQKEQQQHAQQKPQLSQHGLNREPPVSQTYLHGFTGQALPQQQSQVSSGSMYAAGAATQQEQQLHSLNLKEQAGTEDILRSVSGRALQDMRQQEKQQQQLPVATAGQQLETRQEEAAAGLTDSTLSDSGDARDVAQSTKQQEKKMNACKGTQKAAARVTAARCNTNASQKTSCFEILYQDALHRRTRQLRAELGRDRAARTANRQTCTPQQWEQRWNLMIKRHQGKISFNEALKRKLEVSKREDEGRECTFKPVTWSLRKPLVQQKRRLLRLEALAEQQQVLKEALFVLQYEEKQMDEYIAIKLQEEVGRASIEEKSDEELKKILDFYRDRKIEETNRHRSMKLDLLTQLIRLDQQYKRTAASGNLQDTEAAEAVGFDLSLSDKIREDIMDELDSVNSLRSGAKFRAIWEASLPVYSNCYAMEELQSDTGSPDFTLGGCAAGLAAGPGGAAAYPGGRMSLARHRGGGYSDRQAFKSFCQYRRRSSSSSSDPSRSTMAGKPLSRNTFSSPSSSCLSKSRRGSTYNAATSRGPQAALRMSHYTSPPISPHSDSPQHNTLQDACMTKQLRGGSFALLEGSFRENALKAELPMQQDDSQLQLQQQVGLSQHKKGLEEEQQQTGMQRGLVGTDEYERDSEQQEILSPAGSNISSTRYCGSLTGNRPVAVAGNAVGRYLERAPARENFLQTLHSTGVRLSMQQQRGWQPHQLGINGNLQFHSTETQQQPEPSLHMVATAAAATQQSQLQRQQLSTAAHVAATSADIRNPGQLHSGAVGQQAVASQRGPAFYAEQQPNRASHFQMNEGSLQQVPNKQQQPLLLQHDSLYPLPHGNAQLQQLQMQKEQRPLSQRFQWQGSAAAASRASSQHMASPGASLVAAQQQSLAYSNISPVFPPETSSSMQTLQGPPSQANQQQGLPATGSGRTNLTLLQQQQTGRQQQQAGKHPQAVQQQQNTAAQRHIAQRPVVPSGAPAGQHSSTGVNSSPALSAAVSTPYQTGSPPVAQTSAFASPQLANQARRVSAAGASGATLGRAGAETAEERPVESWPSSLLGWHGRLPPVSSQLQQQQQKAEKGFVLPPAAAVLQHRNNTPVKGNSFVHMPPFPAAGAGLVDFAAAAKLCQRGNMLFAAR